VNIGWEPGTTEAARGTRRLDLRYDLVSDGPSRTTVTLAYDWSNVLDPDRELIGFPPFPVDHLTNTPAHLDELVA